MTKISDWLLGHYKKKFGQDLVVLEHHTGSTWNDGGSWNNTIVDVGGETLMISMPSDYNTDRLDVTKLKKVMKESYEPA